MKKKPQASFVLQTATFSQIDSFHGKFTQFALQSRDGIISLFLDCAKYPVQFTWISPQPIPIESTDTLHLASDGEAGKFEVGVQADRPGWSNLQFYKTQ